MSDGSTDHPQLVSRRNLLSILGGLGLTSSVFARALLAQADAKGTVTAEMVRQAEWIADLELTDEQRQKLSSDLEKNARDAERIRAIACDADIPPASVFRPDWFAEPDAKVRLTTQRTPHSAPSPVSQPTRPGAMAAFPDNELGIAFASLIDQAAWLKAGKLSSVDLTKLYLDRLTKFDAELHCVVTLLSETALQQAQAADARRAAGKSIGILDGIPWVAKDLMAVPPFKTTWGAEAYKDQVRLTMSTVAERLQAAGGVLLAKVSLGALALGDIWFGGTTRNPWQTEQGSSGSSAGTCSAVVAGLASYGIGSETLGSIVSPCTRCCVSGLRPSYGRVSRFGCMPLAWSFDKLGPIARHIDDLGIVFSHILGPDGYDPTVVDRDFDWPNEKPLDQLVVGITEEPLSPIEQQALDWLKSKGARQVAVKLPDRFPLGSMTFMLNVEAATVFDDILRSDPDAGLGLWPPSFRKSQFVTAVQYLRASRLRTQLVQETEQVLRGVDVLLGADDLVLTNLSGHPSLIVALAKEEPKDLNARPATIKLTSALYRESTLLSVGRQLQQALPPITLGR